MAGDEVDFTGRSQEFIEAMKRSYPSTPTKLATVAESSEENAEPATPGTVRTRRGYRPLSVLTHSLLDPVFDAPTLKAMELLPDQKNNTLNRVQLAKTSHHNNGQTPSKRRLEITPPRYVPRSASMKPELQRSGMTIMEALNELTPMSAQMEADYPTLYNMPPPDISQHPAFQKNPFSSQSDAPNMVTSSTAEEIRQFSKNIQLTKSQSSTLSAGTSSGSDTVVGSGERKFSIFEGLRTPESLRKKASRATFDSTIASKYKSSENLISPTTPASDTLVVKKNQSRGLRKMSDVFRPKSGEARRASEPIPALPDTIDTTVPAYHRAIMEERLRRLTACLAYPNHSNSAYPRHPETGRNWKSRNLKCTTCIDVACACCGRACCAYKAAVLALENHKHNPDGYAKAVDRMQEITFLFPYGRELPTFLRCSGGTGCEKLVCPDCCGACPDPICKDIQCRKCKKHP